MYTLINAPVLGFDLSRLPYGHLVADLVLRALELTPADLPTLAAAHAQDGARDAAWLELAVAERSTVAQGLRLAAERLSGGAPTDSVLSSLERLAVGDLDGLLRLVRHDLLDWTWTTTGDGSVGVQTSEAVAASALLCDAAAAAYAADRLSAEARRRLGGPWLALCRRVPTPVPDLGPQAGRLHPMFARIAALTPAEVDELLAVVSASRDQLAGWASAMHAATWAVELTGRGRPAASAQMLLVAAVSGTIATRASARGAWNLLSGLVHSLVVEDVLNDDAVDRLVPAGLRRLAWVTPL